MYFSHRRELWSTLDDIGSLGLIFMFLKVLKLVSFQLCTVRCPAISVHYQSVIRTQGRGQHWLLSFTLETCKLLFLLRENYTITRYMLILSFPFFRSCWCV